MLASEEDWPSWPADFLWGWISVAAASYLWVFAFVRVYMEVWAGSYCVCSPPTSVFMRPDDMVKVFLACKYLERDSKD